MSITNGDFETGDLTGWNTSYLSSSATVAVTEDAALGGSYGCEALIDKYGGKEVIYITQENINLDDMNTFTMSYKIPQFTSYVIHDYLQVSIYFYKPGSAIYMVNTNIYAYNISSDTIYVEEDITPLTGTWDLVILFILRSNTLS